MRQLLRTRVCRDALLLDGDEPDGGSTSCSPIAIRLPLRFKVCSMGSCVIKARTDDQLSMRLFDKSKLSIFLRNAPTGGVSSCTERNCRQGSK